MMFSWRTDMRHAILEADHPTKGEQMSEDLYIRNPNQITMYGVSWCPDCRRAKFFFERKKIPYLEVNVDQDKKAAEFVKELNNGNRSVPTILFPDGTMLVEPSKEQLEEKFKAG
jgi:mycoredoxin